MELQVTDKIEEKRPRRLILLHAEYSKPGEMQSCSCARTRPQEVKASGTGAQESRHIQANLPAGVAGPTSRRFATPTSHVRLHSEGFSYAELKD